MAGELIRNGFGQVEPNHLSAQKTGQIYAQLPAASTISQLENGQYAKYDYATGKVNLTGEGEWLMVFNEVHNYDERDRFYKDYVMKKTDFNDNIMTPRLIKTNVGDIYTTNTLKSAGSYRTNTTTEAYSVSDHLVVNSNGFLEKDTQTTPGTWDTTTGMIWKVVKVYTLADAQAALKIQRIN